MCICEIILFATPLWVSALTSARLSFLVCTMKSNNWSLTGFTMRSYWENSYQMPSLMPDT